MKEDYHVRITYRLLPDYDVKIRPVIARFQKEMDPLQEEGITSFMTSKENAQALSGQLDGLEGIAFAIREWRGPSARRTGKPDNTCGF